jgi:hypothetical protein
MLKPVRVIRSVKSRATSNCHDVVLARMPQPNAAALEAGLMEQEQHRYFAVLP